MHRFVRTPHNLVDALRSLESFTHGLAAGYRTDGYEVLPTLEALHASVATGQTGSLVSVLRTNAVLLGDCPVARRKFFHAARALIAHHQLVFDVA
ncbi:MAG: hypothetical protein HYV09_29460 [Deltaproteobacteria bacterium]|nr:hypothetical protein [Deltaproteobacteria bacterium]